jgi:hypothetical protein
MLSRYIHGVIHLLNIEELSDFSEKYLTFDTIAPDPSRVRPQTSIHSSSYEHSITIQVLKLNLEQGLIL